MSEAKQYIEQIYQEVKERDSHQPEFLQAVHEFFYSIEPVLSAHPEFIKENILGRIVEPERIIQFRVPWVTDQGEVKINRAFRVQFNSAIGPYKGGLRFHPTVDQSIVKFLGFEQIFKNSLTGLPIGGGKGGSDFDPKGKSDAEVMRFCQSLMTELQKYIGPDMDVPAGDIGVGAREIGYLYGQYKKLNGSLNGVLTGKPLLYGGSIGRTEATGYGLVYFTKAMLEDAKKSFKQQRVIVSGSGNVATYAMEKVREYEGTVIACSDSDGYIIDEEGIDIELVKDIKENRRGRISEYVSDHPNAAYYEGNVWNHKISYDIALPCATQNEITKEAASTILGNGVYAVAEGANMPTDLESTKLFQEAGVLFGPAKAANAGGVAVSALEMSQNSQRLSWTLEDVDNQLKSIMENIYKQVSETAKEYGVEGDFAAGANIAGFYKVANAMVSQGIV
ncbi:NADP-specific glutamate dehydrogenase [Desemzia incerta]|uniref:NADP-specific glutamate dehydrogenase n=1 Tax=Desemzia incerta TaxID=82801 RepID=UPI001660A5E2|nr:NADP-specific glutamate dehydrogenase [Desemzia incerta]